KADLRRTLYASEMNLAQAAWESGNAARVLDLLRRQRPGPGEDDLRGFEWHYWNRLCRTELRTVKLPFGMILGAFSADGTRYLSPRRGSTGGAASPTEVELHQWDAGTGKELPVLRPYAGTSLRSFAMPTLSADGKRVAFVGYVSGPAGREECRLKVLDCDTGRERLALADFPASPSPPFDRAGGRLAVPTTPPE